MNYRPFENLEYISDATIGEQSGVAFLKQELIIKEETSENLQWSPSHPLPMYSGESTDIVDPIKTDPTSDESEGNTPILKKKCRASISGGKIDVYVVVV